MPSSKRTIVKLGYELTTNIMTMQLHGRPDDNPNEKTVKTDGMRPSIFFTRTELSSRMLNYVLHSLTFLWTKLLNLKLLFLVG